MKFCAKCVMPDTKPGLRFDENGVCDACRFQEVKDKNIDWNARWKQFPEIVKKYKRDKHYDCIIGVSGGKDSTFQTATMLQMGLNPLCVCFEATIPTEIGKKNLANLNKLGVDLLHIKTNPLVHKILIKEGMKKTGDCEWPTHIGILAAVLRVAVKFNIPLIVWGENSAAEYGGGKNGDEEKFTLEINDYITHNVTLKTSINDMLGIDGISEKDLAFYSFPEEDELKKLGITGIFLGQFIKYSLRNVLEESQKHGFSRASERVETTYENFENLDCYSNHVHDYLKYVKFGFGRASDNACQDVRLGLIDRPQAVRLVSKFDGIPPMRAINEFLKYTGFSKEEFDVIVNSFTNENIFQKDEYGRFIKDIDGSLVRKEECLVL